MTAFRPDLDVYEIAFLAGGVQRVVDTALVALVESGRVAMPAPRQMAAVRPDRGHPVEGAVLDAVGTRGHRSVDTIRWRVGRDDRLTGLGRSLHEAGLLRRRMLHGRGTWCPTRAGREALRLLSAHPPVDPAFDGGSAPMVALHGSEAMGDAQLRAAIFERPALPSLTSREISRRVRKEQERGQWDDPVVATHQTRNAWGGAAAFGFMEGGGGGDG